MSRITTAYVSRYQRNRIHAGRFVRGESFDLTANLNGCLASGAEIASIVWRVSNPSIAILGAATVDDRSASVVCTAGVQGGTLVKALVTADDGAVFTQLFEIAVKGEPWFQGETAPATGPYSVSA